MNPKNDHFLELSMWALAELNMNPANTKKFYNVENYNFFANFLDKKYPPMVNSIAMKVLADFIPLAPPDVSFKYLQIIIDGFIHHKTITLRS